MMHSRSVCARLFAAASWSRHLIPVNTPCSQPLCAGLCSSMTHGTGSITDTCALYSSNDSVSCSRLSWLFETELDESASESDGFEIQNLNALEAAFSWLCHIPMFSINMAYTCP